MPGNLFTLMVIPATNGTVKKITIPGYLGRCFCIFFLVVFIVFLYLVYDYASIKRDKTELLRLRAQAKEQSR